jgi:hypothetical protein
VNLSNGDPVTTEEQPYQPLRPGWVNGMRPGEMPGDPAPVIHKGVVDQCGLELRRAGDLLHATLRCTAAATRQGGAKEQRLMRLVWAGDYLDRDCHPTWPSQWQRWVMGAAAAGIEPSGDTEPHGGGGTAAGPSPRVVLVSALLIYTSYYKHGGYVDSDSEGDGRDDEDTFEMGRAKENMHEARRIMLQDMTGARLEKACLRHVNCPPRAEGIQVALVLNAVNPFYLWWSCMVRTGR